MLQTIKDLCGIWRDYDIVDNSHIYCGFGFWLRTQKGRDSEFYFRERRILSWE